MRVRVRELWLSSTVTEHSSREHSVVGLIPAEAAHFLLGVAVLCCLICCCLLVHVHVTMHTLVIVRRYTCTVHVQYIYSVINTIIL